MEHYDLLIIGAGAAGMAASLTAESRNLGHILLIDRNPYLGGILPQCIHHGFGLARFHEDLTGPEYAEKFIERLRHSTIEIRLETTAVSISETKEALLSSPGKVERIGFDYCILCTGARERPIGSLAVPGTRPPGIFTAGQAQKLLNLGGYDIGKRAVILGTGDIGQIVARRLRLLNREVVAMVEIQPKLGGLARNQQNCIRAFQIPVFLNSTVSQIHGTQRICGVSVRHLDTDSTEFLACDTLITAIGLIPERDLVTPLLSDGSAPPWVHFCGNCDSIHEIVDSVSSQAESLISDLAF